MGEQLNRIERRRRAKKTLEQLYVRSDTTLVIHYSCESFYNIENGRTPRITSIAIRNLESGQTESFSIHKVAEQNSIAFQDIDRHYDTLERQMLDEYFGYIHARQGYSYIHWNMRNINYGFAAIEHRYKVLGTEPYKIADDKKFDLSKLLIDIYGTGYMEHPRLEKLIANNHITKLDYLTGSEEAVAFQNKEYVRLHRSTLRKVDILGNIAQRTTDNILQTNAKWTDVYGLTPQTASELIKEHWFFVICAFVAGIVGLGLTIWSL